MKKKSIYKIKHLFVFTAAVSFLILNSCSSPTEPEDKSIPPFEAPVINGIILTNIFGPEEIGRWRNPQYPPGVYFKKTNKVKDEILPPNKMDMDNPYPNPTTDMVKIRFSLPHEAEVSIWIVKGRLAEERPNPAESGAGGVFVLKNNTPAIVLCNKKRLATGLYEEFFEGKIGGNYIHPGFYRIYFKADRHLFWRDILVAQNKADLPPELRDRYFRGG